MLKPSFRASLVHVCTIAEIVAIKKIRVSRDNDKELIWLDNLKVILESRRSATVVRVRSSEAELRR